MPTRRPTASKTQAVRLLDVFVFGPLMLMSARDQKSAYFSTALTLIGIGTIVYNGVNYLQNRDADASAARSAPDGELAGCGETRAGSGAQKLNVAGRASFRLRKDGPRRPARRVFNGRG